MNFNTQYYTYDTNNENEDTENIENCEIEVENFEKGTDELLIDAVRSYPHLYNSSLKDFKDTQMKHNSWREISGILNLSIEICQNRWVRLRDRFSREKRLRETETRSGSGVSHRSGFPLYNNMLFLENHVKRRKSYTNVPSSAKKRLMDISNTSSCDNISNISTSCQTLSNDTNKSFSNSSNFILSKHYKSNIQKNNTQTEKTVQPDRPFLSLSLCETNDFSFTNELITDSVWRDSVPRESVSRESVPRDSISRDSISTSSASRNSPSPANPLSNTDRSNKKNKSNSYLEHTATMIFH